MLKIDLVNLLHRICKEQLRFLFLNIVLSLKGKYWLSEFYLYAHVSYIVKLCVNELQIGNQRSYHFFLALFGF